jgi:Spy/CpxP family protein refolding chaperone
MAMRDVKAANAPEQESSAAWRWMAIGVLVVAAAGAALNVHAQGMGGSGPHGHAGGPGMMMFGGPPEHVARAVDHMLDGLGATDAQRTQIKQIAVAGRGLRDKGLLIFASANVDAGAAESLRQQMLAQQDLSSKRVLQAMLDISKVLTPEQRANLGERIKLREAAVRDRMQREQREHRDRPQK